MQTVHPPKLPARSASPTITRHRNFIVEPMLLAAAFAVAVLLRWPYLHDVPRYTDELQEVLWSIDIARGQMLPLTAVDSYYGPLWSYLLAGLFALFGPSPHLPRMVAAVLGASLVVLTYGFGKSVVGRWPAAIAAALVLTSGGQIIINSHTARSNNVTPLLTTAALWLLWLALEPRPWLQQRCASAGTQRLPPAALLVPAGLLIGLALQTHLSVIALLPGLALYGIWRGRPLLRTAWPYLALLAVVLGYLNMIVYNVLNDFWSVRHARSLQEGYVGGRSTDFDYYLANLGALVQSLTRLLSGTIDGADSPARFVYAALALSGLALLIWQRRGLLMVLAALSICLVLPYFNPRYGPILSGRYLIPLLPIGYLAIGVTITTLARKLQPRRARAVAATAALVLALFPLWALAAYYGTVLADGRTNEPLHRLRAAVVANRAPDELVMLDEGLAQESLGAGGTDLKALRMLLGTSDVPYTTGKVSEGDDIALGRPSVLAIMEAKKRAILPRELRAAALSAEIESASGSEHRYVLYRITARG
jgi:glycosyltransferase AglD